MKDGAFRVAVNTQTPIVPVSIVNNWIILPLDFLLKWTKITVVVHEPINVEGLTEKEIPDLKQQVAGVIAEGIN